MYMSKVQRCQGCAFSILSHAYDDHCMVIPLPIHTVLPEPKMSIDGVYNCAGNVLVDRSAS